MAVVQVNIPRTVAINGQKPPEGAKVTRVHSGHDTVSRATTANQSCSNTMANSNMSQPAEIVQLPRQVSQTTATGHSQQQMVRVSHADSSFNHSFIHSCCPITKLLVFKSSRWNILHHSATL